MLKKLKELSRNLKSEKELLFSECTWSFNIGWLD